jgi:hypothetical protein
VVVTFFDTILIAISICVGISDITSTNARLSLQGILRACVGGVAINGIITIQIYIRFGTIALSRGSLDGIKWALIITVGSTI